MLPVRGKPMLEHIVDRARSEGFSRFVFAINYLGHLVEDDFGNGSRWQVDISYVRETSPLGTADSKDFAASPNRFCDQWRPGHRPALLGDAGFPYGKRRCRDHGGACA